MNTCRVILVDDDSDETELFTDALQATKSIFVHAVCSSYTQLLLALETSQMPDLILCDLKMPKINGIEVKQALQAWEKYGNIPFVLISGPHPPAAIISQAAQNNIQAILLKPYSSGGYQQLSEQLIEICSHKNIQTVVLP